MVVNNLQPGDVISRALLDVRDAQCVMIFERRMIKEARAWEIVCPY